MIYFDYLELNNCQPFNFDDGYVLEAPVFNIPQDKDMSVNITNISWCDM